MAPRPEHLRLVQLFRGFTDDELAGVAALFEPVVPRDGGTVFETGEPATELYLLISGEVTLVRPADDTYRLRPPALIGGWYLVRRRVLVTAEEFSAIPARPAAHPPAVTLGVLEPEE